MKKSKFFVVPFLMFLCTGFSLNKLDSTFNLKSVNNSVLKANSRVIEKSFNETTKHEINVMSPVFINTFINSLDELKGYSENEATRPSNILLRINKDIELVNESGESLGISFKEAYETYIKEKMLPVIYFDTEEVATALKAYLDETFCPLDMAVCSSDPTLLKQVRNDGNGQKIRGILDYSNNDEAPLVDYVNVTNSSWATTVILSQEFATEENIRYIESRFKSVWVNVSDYSDINIVRLVTDGVYGIITENVSEALDTFKVFENTDNAKYNMNRVPFNIGHRGLPYQSYENSMEGYRMAYEMGATHIETDIMITKDKKLVVMHDTDLSIATNGTGQVADKTSDELKEFKITKYRNLQGDNEGVPIPFLDDVFKEFKGNGKIIIVEIKDANPETVTVLKEYMDEYDMYDQVVFISFTEAQLKLCKQLMPEVPCATLNNYTESMFTKTTSDGVVNLNMFNFSSDFNRGIFTKEYDFNLAERGFTSFYWTFDQVSSLYTGAQNGISGLTTDHADVLGDYATKIVPIEGETYTFDPTQPLEEQKFNVNYVNYKGEVSEDTLEASAIITEKNEDGTYSAILQAQFVGPNSTPRYRAVVFSDTVTLKASEKTPDEPNELTDPVEPNPPDNMPLIIGLSVGGGVAVCGGGAGLAVYLLKRKKK